MEKQRRLILLTCILLLACPLQHLYAQTEQSPSGQIELFCGANLGYADTNWKRLYDLQIEATPGLRWHLGNDLTIAAQGIIPLLSEGYTFRDVRYKFWRGNMAVLSKQLHLSKADQHFRLSAGFFGRERYGVDVQWAWPVNSWLLLNARTGLTSHWILGTDFKGTYEADLGDHFSLTATAGARVFLRPWNIELRASGGRYIEGDYGSQVDVMRHFRHCTLLMFAQLRLDKTSSLYDKFSHRTNAGFKVIMMIPPYKKSHRKWVVRPSSNFRLTNNIRSDGYSMRTYYTDPEENERELQVDVDWGLEAQSDNDN